MTAISKSSLVQAVHSFSGNDVIIIGDIMLDLYQFGVVERISPEAPVPIVQVHEDTLKLGGASNVAQNIKALGGNPFLISVAGNDANGNILNDLVVKEQIESIILKDAARNTTTKTRVIANNQQVARVDKESNQPISENTQSQIIDAIHGTITQTTTIIISDYGKGVISANLLQQIVTLKNEYPDLTILVDPKVKNFPFYTNVTLLTPNKLEASQSTATIIESDTTLKEAAQKIFKQLQCEHLLITLGSQGMAFFENSTSLCKIPTVAHNVFDVTGAGDTVIATLGLAIESGVQLLTSCLLANYAAGLVTSQIGTASITQQELTQSIESLPDPLFDHM